MGNLPFNVATTLLLQWLRELAPPSRGLFADTASRPVDMTLMFQTEVAQVRKAPRPSLPPPPSLAMLITQCVHQKLHSGCLHRRGHPSGAASL